MTDSHDVGFKQGGIGFLVLTLHQYPDHYTIEMMNPAFKRIFYCPQDKPNAPFLACIQPQYHEAFDELFNHLLTHDEYTLSGQDLILHAQKMSNNQIAIQAIHLDDLLQHDTCHQVVNLSPDLMGQCSLDFTLIKNNPAWSKHLGYAKAHLSNANLIDLIHPEDQLALLRHLRQKNEHDVIRLRILDHQKQAHPFEWHFKFHERHFFVYATDISDQLAKEKEIAYLSYHDALTGLYNRRFIEEEMRRLNTLRNHPFTLLLGDLNQLKLVNDVFSHQHGDELIKLMATVLKAQLRPDDLIARMGGDEFLILLPRTSQADAERIIERIHEACQDQHLNGIELSIAFGAYTRLDPSEDFTHSLKNAEDHMYQLKGTNSVRDRTQMIDIISNTLFAKHPEEERHARHVASLAQRLGKALGFNTQDLKTLRLAALLHDIGKVAIDPAILNKPDRLSEDEQRILHQHPVLGQKIIGYQNDMKSIAEAILQHHERLDGSGYPHGIKEINDYARIIAICDTYDVMTHPQAYQAKHSQEVAIQELKRLKKAQLDGHFVDVFIQQVLRQTA